MLNIIEFANTSENKVRKNNPLNFKMNKAASKKKLFHSIKTLIQQAQQYIVRNINTTMLITYFEIGKMIVEDEQQGKRRAGYAQETIKNLSTELNEEFVEDIQKTTFS